MVWDSVISSMSPVLSEPAIKSTYRDVLVTNSGVGQVDGSARGQPSHAKSAKDKQPAPRPKFKSLKAIVEELPKVIKLFRPKVADDLKWKKEVWDIYTLNTSQDVGKIFYVSGAILKKILILKPDWVKYISSRTGGVYLKLF